jgi:hypothetical protein
VALAKNRLFPHRVLELPLEQLLPPQSLLKKKSLLPAYLSAALVSPP